MKILLVALNAKYVHSNLAVHNLKAYAEGKFHRMFDVETREREGILTNAVGKVGTLPEIVIREYTINHNLDVILQSIYEEKAMVVAFSCYIWNVHEILTIAKELHKVSSETHIWLGGPEVSYNSVSLLEQNPFVEGIMRGEGEETFYQLAGLWKKMISERIVDNYKDINGITYRNEMGDICRNPDRALLSMDAVPFIYDNLEQFENKILYYETSRGCPFSCSYCLSSIDKSVRFRSLSLVEKELQFFLDNRVQQIKLIDRTFNCRREHALAIWRYITEHDNGITNFHFEVSADLLEEEELSLFATMRPGLIQLEIGLQSTNPETITEIRRTMNLKKVKENLLKIHEMGNIHQHLDLIAGLPCEDFTTFRQSFNDAYEMKPNQLQLGFLKVLKGSYMEEQIAEYQLQYQEMQPYEVLDTKWITYDEILRLKRIEEMVEVYYNSDQFEHTLSYLVPLFDTPYHFYEALGDYYKNHALFGIGVKRESRYEVLRQFCTEWFDKSDEGWISFDEKLLVSLLTFDYYLRENAKSRPSWAKEEPIEKETYHRFFRNGGNEELCLAKEGYDSKVAARKMHIEPLVSKAAKWILGAEQVVFSEEGREIYALFDYENRNPLSGDAEVSLLSHLE